MAAPYVKQDAAANLRVVQRLEAGRRDKKSEGFTCKKTLFKVQKSSDGIQVESWRLQDWEYKKPYLPTYARGLFTTKNAKGDQEIVVRGYDKFFNVEEVANTKWESIFERTKGPYELTLKENGCIIFVAGLEDDTLLVCSKHSTGGRADLELSHAHAGEIRIEKQLAAIGKTPADLARELRARNATAVAELCDDSFEEHILAYEGDKAGLYLHGINLNLPEFATYPSSLVQEFAQQWGFIKTDLLVMDKVDEVRTFLEDVAKSGAHNGRDVEGFVIRCQTSEDPATIPYRDWFFKYKFEEPYLMYRQWRECTKALIARKPPRYKKHIRMTEEYLAYARKRLIEDPGMATLYNRNHGIIKLRDDFLAYKNMRGADAAKLKETERVILLDTYRDVILTPVATIGCGKTTLALALGHLFNWGHIQNDNISGKGRPPRFVKAILDELKQYPAVFADRNNTAKHERKQLITDVKTQMPSAKLREKFVGVMEGFITRFEECCALTAPDSAFDLIIDLDPTVGSRQNLETVVSELHKSLPGLVTEMPSPEKLDLAIEFALDYKPDFRHTIPDRGPRKNDGGGQPNQQAPQTKKARVLEYMAVQVPRKGVDAALDGVFRNVGAGTSAFYNELKFSNRIQTSFHVTLMHRAAAKANPELWARYQKLFEDAGCSGKLGSCDVILERVVFDKRIMAIVVRLVNSEGHWECANQVAHITVGTQDNSVKPKESNDMLAKWLEVGAGVDGDGNDIREVVFPEKPTIACGVHGVLSR
ncbi:tRNA ligase 1 [Escovopsis weberi]|uniref:tRNA ligase 1 n=1 Tax=Escovopsis weberi TaxID=150374 RepID=A0A0M8MZL1_ESCWE|nr:tRNA ligase 1 [Escovopsis weberi]